MATQKIDVKPGTKVHLVHAKGHHLPAKVIKVHAGDRPLVDLEADAGGDDKLIITRSPMDESGKAPDSWHPPEPEATPEAPKA